MILAFKHEWRRFASLRSSWILPVLAIAQSAGFLQLMLTVTKSQDGAFNPPTDFREVVNIIFLPFFTILLSFPAAQAFGHDYRHGTIRLTLSSFPRRSEILVARTMTVILVSLVTFAIAVAIAVANLQLHYPAGTTLDLAASVPTIGRLAVVVLLYQVVVMSLVLLSHNLAFGMVVPLIFVTFLENLLAAVAFFKYPWIVHFLPYINATGWVVEGDSAMGDSSVFRLDNSPWPLTILALLLLLVGSFRFLRRDA